VVLVVGSTIALWGILFSVGLVFGAVGDTMFFQYGVTCDTGRFQFSLSSHSSTTTCCAIIENDCLVDLTAIILEKHEENTYH